MWYLVKWYVKSTSTVRTNWHRAKADAVRTAKREQDKGNYVADFCEVSGNGKRR